MKPFTYVVIAGVFIFLSAHGSGKSNKTKMPSVPKVKAGFDFNHTVIAQTTPEYIGKRGSNQVFRRFYVLRMGAARFSTQYEYGYANFYCDVRSCEQAGESVALKYYNHCKGLKKDGSPNCTGLKSVRTDVTDPLESSNPSRRRWYDCEDYGSPCADRNHNMEDYPERYAPEDPEYPYNF